MNDNKYNGWTNYATWRINIEIFDGKSLSDYSDADDVHNVAEDLRYYVNDYFEQTAQDGINNGFDLSLMRDYALEFISEVNWYEIAQHLVDNYSEESCN
jgi:hypothetical protein